jgi:ATP-dependent DNA ligase
MTLPLHPPFPPMEAKSVTEVPTGKDWQYEPKWDGFRCLAFRDGAKVELQSKSGQPLTRYFPELVEALSALKARQFVLDGEIVVPADSAFSFDALLQRIHPARSRIDKLASETPALLIVFDILVDDKDRSLVETPLRQRRLGLEAFAAKYLRGQKPIRLSPATTRLSDARRWLERVGATLDGIIAKRRDEPYRAGNRTGMQKIKNYRSADCVVGGFRYNEGKKVVGSLLLGLYDDDGLLHHVGFTSTIANKDKPTLTRNSPAMRPAGRAAGRPNVRLFGSRCNPSWSSRSATTILPASASGTAHDCFAGGPTKHPGNARWSSLSNKRRT